jgi:hypothetical protein
MPETKGISLERMDKLFGGIDYVEEGEQQAETHKMELDAYKPRGYFESYGHRDSSKILEITK